MEAPRSEGAACGAAALGVEAHEQDSEVCCGIAGNVWVDFFQHPTERLLDRGLVRLGLDAKKEEEVVGRPGDERSYLAASGDLAAVACTLREDELSGLSPCAGQGLGNDRPP